MNDNWVHKSSMMRCGTCMWFVKKDAQVKDATPDPGLGRCRRHAPKLNGYPAVFDTDWCGDHKMDVDKL